ncbi:MAG: efflux transporter, family, subunit, partial [Hyphomicrobiales bacterium]|nr:efflux transporter, family, subunit [Hyphomicrobiales bacterium]
ASSLALAAAPALAVEALETPPAAAQPNVPVVTVARAQMRTLVETVAVSGTIVPRDEILIGPEIEGFRILEILADEGDRVEAGQVLARLSRETLDAQLAQSDAALVRADAQIAQAQSQIRQAQANLGQTTPDLERAQSLIRTGASTQALVDQKLAADNTARAALDVARQSLNVSQADKQALNAQRRELQVRISRTQVRAPVAGVVSRKNARVGAIAAGIGEAMFKLVANGAYELEGEAFETRLVRLAPGQDAQVSVGDVVIPGKVRLVSPEVDRVTRLGRVRIRLEPSSAARVGGFARGEIVTRRVEAVAVPTGALLYDGAQPLAQVVKDGRIETRKVTVGIAADGFTQIASGVAAGEDIVARAGPFLRDGDFVRPVAIAEAK